MVEEQVLKPHVLSGSFSRILEAILRNNDHKMPGETDMNGRRPLPHFYLSTGIGLLIASPLIAALYFGYLDFSLSIPGLPFATGGSQLAIYGGIILAGALALLPQLYFLKQELKNRKYLITPERVEFQDNYLDKSTDSASLDNVTDVELEKPFIQRPFGTGNILISTAGSNESEIKFEYVKNPETVQKELSGIVSETEYGQEEAL